MTAILEAAPASTDRFVVGVGFSSSASATEIIALIEACLRKADVTADELTAIATHARKRFSPVLSVIASHFGVPLHLLDDDDLDGTAPGVCEAVAAMAGRVRLGKHKSALATCAVATCRSDFSLASFGQPAMPSAAMASSTLLVSTAAP